MEYLKENYDIMLVCFALGWLIGLLTGLYK